MTALATLIGAASAAGLPSPARVRAHPVTFNRDLAPLIFQHCAPCHHPGGAGPFPLLTYSEVRKRSKQLAEVTAKRFMPPWLPAPGFGDFADSRRLSDRDVALFSEWRKDGCAEGAAADLPAAPKYSSQWQLGPPDVVAAMPAPYELGPDGPDVYRNFVMPLALPQNHFVRAFEFQPGNRAIHHVRILLDRSGECRRLDGQDSQPGFSGMRLPARFPPGHLLTWAPGRQPRPNPPGLNWLLEAGSDVIAQIHMQRTGKTEKIQPRIGFYFSDAGPTKNPLVMDMIAQTIDIPAGDANYTIHRHFDLAAGAQLLAVMPHAHYLAREMIFDAILPDGSRRRLLWIPRWDFKWQEEYRYGSPVWLPKGSRLEFSIRYDNSDANIQNPNHPPRRVQFGPQTTDEMGELWMQLLPRNPSDFSILRRQKIEIDTRETARFYERLLQSRPRDASAHVALAKLLGPLGLTAGAEKHFRQALAINPLQPEAHYYLGLIAFQARRLESARAQFESELLVNPRFYKAEVALGMIAVGAQDLNAAENHLRAAQKLHPADPDIELMLRRILRAESK